MKDKEMQSQASQPGQFLIQCTVVNLLVEVKSVGILS